MLLAGLLHDAGKGDTGVWPRVAYSLGQRYGTWVWRGAAVAARVRRRRSSGCGPTPRPRRGSPSAAGCSARTVELIRWQDAPRDPEYGRAAPARRRGELMTGVPVDGGGRPTAGRAGGPLRGRPAPRDRDAGPGRRVRRPARAAAVAHRGAPARRPDRARSAALADAYLDALATLEARPARQRQRVRRGREPADPDQEPGDAAAAAGRATRRLPTTRAPDPEAELRARLLLYRAHRDAGLRLADGAPSRGSGCSAASRRRRTRAGRRRRPARSTRRRSIPAGSSGRSTASPVLAPPPEPPPEVVPRIDHAHRAGRRSSARRCAAPRRSCSRTCWRASATGS